MDLNRRLRPDSSTADRLLAGHIGPDDAPPGYRRVATLLGEAAGGFPEPAGTGEATLVGAMVSAIQAEPVPPVISGRRPMLRKILAAKTIAIASVLALSASGAAAATGNLPDAVQSGVAKAAKHVGLHLPDGKGVVRVTEGCVPAADGSFAKNRGQYLKQERAKGPEALAAAEQSRCGMPAHSKGTPGTDEPEDSGQAGNQGKSGESHGKAGEDHGQAGQDHGQAGDEHGNAGVNENQGQAGEDHGKAGEDHGQAGEDHGQAGEDHGQAGDEQAPPASVVEGS